MDHWRNLLSDVSTTPWVAVVAATLVRWVMGYDATPRDIVGTLVGAAFLVFFIAPGVAEWWGLGPAAAASTGATLALVGRPMVHTIIRLVMLYQRDPRRLRDAFLGKDTDEDRSRD